MRSERPVGIDLFAGAGGMSLGFEQAGFDIAAAVEIDPVHAAVHHFNFPTTRVICRSVAGLSGDEIRSLAGIGRRSVDVVFGGPPCQGFSLMGQRVLEDPRNQLVREFLRIVQELKAKTFVFENVKGLTVGEHRRFLEALIAAFDEIGYRVGLPWRVLNAKHYGVPQDRQRLFLIGAQKGIPLPQYPDALTGDAADFFGGDAPTCASALEDIPNADDYDELMESDSVVVPKWQPSTGYAREAHCVRESGWHLGYRRNWDPAVLTSSTRTVHTDISRSRFLETAPGQVEPVSRFYKLHPNGVCNTLRAGTDSARGAFTSPRPIHYKHPRCITVREMARLHGYPDWFRFHVTKWHGAREVGNSVPPPLARAVASGVQNVLGFQIDAPQQPIDFPDPHFLRMDMREASAHWGIPIPIAGRNRKSGARKRKQSEVEAVRKARAGVVR